MLKYQLPLLAVKDVEVSKRFYGELFGQRVELDLGRNVTFDGGFAVQQDFAWLTGVPEESVHAANNMELYFETDDFDAFLRRLEAFGEVLYVHPPKKHEWRQRVVRLRDPDGHMIEVGEEMTAVARRVHAEGYSVVETARIIQHPLSFVEAALEEKSPV